MGDDMMKTALERAMERADRLQVPEEKIRELEYRSEGERLAAQFLRDPQFDLASALKGMDPKKVKAIAKAVEGILLQNLTLPKKESDLATAERVFAGLALLKQDKRTIEQAKQQLQNLGNYYAQARKQHYDQLRAEVERVLTRTIQQQTGLSMSGMKLNINVEQTAEFQENWRQLSAKLDGEYDKALAQLKQRIASVA